MSQLGGKHPTWAWRHDNGGVDSRPAYMFDVSDGEPICLGDLDGNNDVDVADLAQLLEGYCTTSGAAYKDLALDGNRDARLANLVASLGPYGTTCEQPQGCMTRRHASVVGSTSPRRPR